MGTTAKSLKTRENILTNTLELFKEKGFESTTMRDIAAASGMSVGAAYYHFRSKDDLVLAFYEQTGTEAREASAAFIAESEDFAARFLALINFKFKQMIPYRSFIGVLARAAADPESPLSPFSPETKPIRDEAIELINNCIEGSNLKCAKVLRPHLPLLLWTYQMGLVFYWIHDSSKDQSKTQSLLQQSFSIIMNLLKMSRLPLLTPVNKAAIKLLQHFEYSTNE